MTTLERLQRILMAHYPIKADAITRDAMLEQLDIDSLGMMELFFAIEDEFGISVPNDKRALQTVGAVVDYIDELLLQQKSGLQDGMAVDSPPAAAKSPAHRAAP